MMHAIFAASKTILVVSLFSTITRARKRAGYKVIGVGVHIIIYNWRASEASETLSGLFN